MRRIVCAVGATVWIVGVTVAYLLLIRSQGDSLTEGPVPYVAAAMLAAAVLCGVGAVTPGNRPLLAALSLLGVLVLIGLLSIGLLLVPAVAAVIVAMQPSPAPVGR